MRFETKTRLTSAARAAALVAAVAGIYWFYGRFEALAADAEHILTAASRANELQLFWDGTGHGAGAGDRGHAEFLDRYYALGSALRSSETACEETSGSVFKEMLALYHNLLPAADSYYRSGIAGSAGDVREKAARINRLALTAALANLDERNRLLSDTAISFLLIFMLLILAEAAQHYALNDPLFSDLGELRARLFKYAEPFAGEKYGGKELEFMGTAAELLEGALQRSMLDRLRLTRDASLRQTRSKTQTRTLELTRRKVVALVNDLETAKASLQAEREALRKISERLARSNRELERFAYVASHDLKEPLRIVSSFSGLLSKRYLGKLDKDADDFIRYISEGALRGTELVDALFNYSKVTYSSRQLAPTDCRITLEKAMFNLKMAIDEKKAVISIGRLPTVLGDEFQLMQLFQNLLGNALKFNAAPAPEIKVDCVETELDWILKFSDNGIGIAAEHFERIFMIFQRLHLAEKYPGAGIGLALCKKIAENHGGRIWVESEIGKGSTFFVTLPKAPGGGSLPAAAESGEKVQMETK